jgi:GTP-binding protein
VSEDADKLFSAPCAFVAGAASLDAIPPAGLQEVAFAGRSNVGKSSLINAVLRRKSLARVSQTPGATRQINFFALGEKLVLVDLPGYGFAQASKSLARAWQSLIFSYLRGRTCLKRVILLIDARRGLMPADSEAMRILDEAAVSYLVVLTKLDKLAETEREHARLNLRERVSRHAAAYPDILATSSFTGEGLDALRLHIAALAS